MRYENLLFDDKENHDRLGDIVSLKNEYRNMEEPINFLLSIMENYETDVSHDLSAAERPYFKTLNYTTFGKSLMLAPLQPDLAQQQIIDSIIDNKQDKQNYVDYFANVVKTNRANKYNEPNRKTDYKCNALVVLPGGNKLFTNVCMNKIGYILDEHGKLAVFKPHPLTSKEDLAEFKKRLGNRYNLATILDPYDDLYYYMQKAEIVYTSHCSESALYAACLDKEISPIDTFQTRIFNSFSHVNARLFMNNDLELINKMFSSYKSGLILPEIHTDWKDRIEKYVRYIHDMRKAVRYHYV